MMVLTTRLSESLLPPALDVMRLPHREGEELRETHEVVKRVLDRGEEKQLDQFRPVVDVQHVDARVVEHGLHVSGCGKKNAETLQSFNDGVSVLVFTDQRDHADQRLQLGLVEVCVRGEEKQYRTDSLPSSLRRRTRCCCRSRSSN